MPSLPHAVDLSVRPEVTAFFDEPTNTVSYIVKELQHVILMCPAVNMIDASALESLEAIAHRLASAGVGFHLSEVKGPVMDGLKRSDFFEHFKGQVFLSQFSAIKALSNLRAEVVSP